jgi:UDP-glucose 4-epimerase
MNYLVTGGAGFIGSNLVKSLMNYGNVTVIDNLSTGNIKNIQSYINNKKITFEKINITNLTQIKQYFQGIDYVFHLAAIPNVGRSVDDPLRSHEANATGTLNVLIAARDNDVKKIIYSSSSSVYGDTPELPKKETMKPNPLSPYAVTKLTGEHYCNVFSEIYGLKTVSLRYFNVYGPNQEPHSEYSAVIPNFITKILRDERPTIYGDGNQTRDFTYVKDVVNANLLAIQNDSDGVFNIAGGKRISINELFKKISSTLGKDIQPVYDKPREGDIRDSLADISKAKKYLGYEPDYNLSKGLEETIEWYINYLKKLKKKEP